MALTYEPFDTITVSKVNEKLGGGVEKLNQELNDYLLLSGGEMVGDLVLGYTAGTAEAVKLKMGVGSKSGFEISADETNTLTIRNSYKKSTVLLLTPSQFSLLDNCYNMFCDDGNRIVTMELPKGLRIRTDGVLQLYANGAKILLGRNDKISLANGAGPITLTGVAEATSDNDAVNLAQLKQYLPLNGGTMTGSINMGNQKITRLADGTNDLDAVNLRQLKKVLQRGTLKLRRLTAFGEQIISGLYKIYDVNYQSAQLEDESGNSYDLNQIITIIPLSVSSSVKPLTLPTMNLTYNGVLQNISWLAKDGSVPEYMDIECLFVSH